MDNGTLPEVILILVILINIYQAQEDGGPLSLQGLSVSCYDETADDAWDVEDLRWTHFFVLDAERCQAAA